MPIGGNAHGSVGGRRHRRAERGGGTAADNIEGLPRQRDGLCQCRAGKRSVQPGLLFVEDEGGNKLLRGAVQGDGAVSGEAGHADSTAADRGRTVCGCRAGEGQAASRIAGGTGRRIIRIDNGAVVLVLYFVFIPLLDILAVIICTGAGGGGLHVLLVSTLIIRAVMKLRGGHGDLMVADVGARLGALIERGGADLAHDDLAGSGAAGDVGAVGGGHQVAGDIDGSVDVHQHVHAVIGGTGIGHRRRERQRHRILLIAEVLVIAIGCLVPLVAVVNKEVHVAAQGDRCPLIHPDAGAGQQLSGIGNRRGTGVDVDIDVVGNRQNVLGGRNRDTHIHGDSRQRCIAIYIDGQTIRSGIITFCNRTAAAHAKQAITGTDEGNISRVT